MNAECTATTICNGLSKFICVSGRGFRFVETMVIVNGQPKTRFRGVSYHASWRDRGIMVNFCPFCGKTPGDIAGPQPTPPPQAARRDE